MRAQWARAFVVILFLLVSSPGSASAGSEFIRGDCDSNGVFNGLADGLYILTWAFLAGPPPLCDDACDADDSGILNGLSDGLYILTHQFLGGPPPPAPFPTCGTDTTSDGLGCQGPVTGCGPAGSPYDPSWGDVPPTTEIVHTFNPGVSEADNGEFLKAAIQALAPGEQLTVGAGTYEINTFFQIQLAGTPANPIRIVAADGVTPVITRANANQNTININQSSYLLIRGFEITSGSFGVRIDQSTNLWIDDCVIHDTDLICIAAGLFDSSSDLSITRNEIHDPGPDSDCVRFGSTDGSQTVTDSVVALNEIYGTTGIGQGLDIKRNSSGNWICENEIRDCESVCLLVGGTNGATPNLIEKNTIHTSLDNVVQLENGAVFRNNLVGFGLTALRAQPAFAGVESLTIVHNTFLNNDDAAVMDGWSGQPDLVFANNACYSETGDAIRFIGGSTGVTIAGNIHFGTTTGFAGGSSPGTGLGDFVNVTWDGLNLNALPSPGSPLIGSASAAHAVADDIVGTPRTDPYDAGCFETQ